MLLVDILEPFAFQVCLKLWRSDLNFALLAFLWWKEYHISRLVNVGQKVLQLVLVLEDCFHGASYVPSDGQDFQVLVAWINRHDSGIFVLLLTLVRCPPLSFSDGSEVRIIVLDAEESSELENLMDGLEYNCDVIKAISKFVLHFHLYRAIVAPRDIELVHLFIIKCVKRYFLAIPYFKYLESDVLVDELTIFISKRLSMQIYVVPRIIINEHHAFEANLRIAILLLTSDELFGNPIHTSFILITLESNFLYWFV